MRRSYILTSAAAGLLAFGTSCGNVTQTREQMPNVQVYEVESSGATTSTEFPGRVKAAEELNIAFKLSGTLQRVYVKEGDHIVKGQIIAQLDPRDYQTQLDAVEGEYMSIKSEAERVIALYADSVATAAAYDKARFGLQQISAKYKNAQDQLEDTKLFSPFDGYVQECLFDTPSVVAAGMPVVILVSSKTPEIEINIPASTYVHRKEIVSLQTSFDFIDSKEIPLGFVSITPKANANQLYTVRLSIPSNLSQLPSPGMSAMVKVTQKVSDDEMVEIPSSALFEDNGESYVWIYQDGVVNPRQVSVRSLHISGRAVISEGIDAGEEVVTSGVHSLKSGQKVNRMPQASKTNVGGLL